MEPQTTERSTAERKTSPGMRTFAMSVSYLFHPAFMPTIMAVLLYKLAPASFAGIPPDKYKLVVLSFFINTAFFPILITMLLKAVGLIESMHLHTTKDRIIPLLGTMIVYFWMNQVVKNLHYPEILHVLSLGSFWGVIAVFMINIFMKISMHTAAAGSMLGVLLILMFTSPVNMVLPFFLALIIAGLIGTARMALGAHINAEIWLGYLIGILVMATAHWYL